MNKKVKQKRIRHAIRRAQERFGILISPYDVLKLGNMIRKKEAKFLDRQTGTITRWIVDLHGKQAVAVYNSHSNVVVTVYEYDEEFEKQQGAINDSRNSQQPEA